MKPRVLIVDDSIESRLLLEQKMLIDGYDAESTDNGMDGITKAEEFRPDIILLDVMMPKMDGYETCRRLKANDSTRYIPVILLTARGELEDKVMGLEVGADDYVVKPYNIVEVSARVKSFLRTRAMQAKLSESIKLAALGEMVDGIVHELRNPIVTIGGMARRLYEHENDSEHKLYAKTILDAAERMEKMTHRIDEYKGVLNSELRIGNVNDSINGAIDELRSVFDESMLKTSRELLPVPPPVNLDVKHMKIAIFNILQNAAEAVSGKGELKVRSYVNGGFFDVTIEDKGIGMDDAEIKDIFNPFQTSKMTGAGMGLTIAHRIVVDHGGSIEVKSKKGEGTMVTIRLPLAAGA